MRALILGSGSREYALARRLIEENTDVCAMMTRPNAGLVAMCRHAQLLSQWDVGDICSFAKKNCIDLIVPCDESVLFLGIGSASRRLGIPCFGPSEKLAQLESNKSMAKNWVALSHPEHVVTGTVIKTRDQLQHFLRDNTANGLVLKSGGYCSANDILLLPGPIDTQAIEKIQAFFNHHQDDMICAEPFVQGDDFSLSVFLSNGNISPPIVLKDYPFLAAHSPIKTGGMGSVSFSDNAVRYGSIFKDALALMIDAVRQAEQQYNETFRGFIVGQFLLTKDHWYFNEFDVRLGDPETVLILDSMQSPLGSLLTAVAEGKKIALDYNHQDRVVLSLAPPGYPNTHQPIGFTLDTSTIATHWLTIGNVETGIHEGEYLSGHGRSLTVSGSGTSINKARKTAYARARSLGTQLVYREDIGQI